MVRNVYKEAIKKWGMKLQLLCLIEEMGELSQQIIKKFRGTYKKELLLEEMVDVAIMLEQGKLLFSQKEWDDTLKSKLTRLKRRLKR